MKRLDCHWQYRAYFTSWINSYAFLEVIRERTNNNYQGFSIPGGYVIMW
jgi:hypothetical protein